jgi:hypothetical protein
MYSNSWQSVDIPQGDPAMTELTTTPIAAAVLPLLETAQDRAEKFFHEHAAKVLADLATLDNDLTAYAPYPSSGLSRASYKKALAKREWAQRLTTYDDARGRHCRRPGDPEYRLPCPKGLATGAAQARAMAAQQYLGFIAKLEGKAGEHTAATLQGEHVWGFSVLTVTKADGSVERWRTQCIINISGLGTVFNQWPTRKMKGIA